MREFIIAGLAATPIVAFLSELDEVKPPPRLAALFDLLVEASLLKKKGDKYKKADTPPLIERGPIQEAISQLFQDVAFPHLVSGSVARELTPHLQRAAYTYTAAYQAARVAVVHDILTVGGLTLVAGWWPCGMSSELMSIAGRDVVVVEEREDLVALEMDRLSLLPLSPAPIGQDLAAATFYSFEIVPLEETLSLADKYGKFDAVVICNRWIKPQIALSLANTAYYIIPKDPLVFTFNNILLGALGLQKMPPDASKQLKKARREETSGFDVLIASQT